jgi:transposase
VSRVTFCWKSSATCGHVSRAQPWRAPPDSQWEKVELGEWRLVGPQLAGVLVFLGLRMRLSRARIREGLMELFGLMLSTGVIDETIREAGRASFPLEDVLVADIVQAPQLNVDETSWKESGLLLWLWALVTTHTVLFLIGPRTAEMLENALQDGYHGILISDGYVVYRAWKNRLRCWPHLMRKLRGLAESTDRRVAGVGKEMEGLMQTLMDAIYAARIDPPPEGLPVRYAVDIARLRHLCETHRMDAHPALRSVVREFLYDWDVILRPVAEPHLPLSNNAAEQALRHWVIARYISHGTRSEAGSRAFALLASVIETCRRRKGLCLALPRHRHRRRSQGFAAPRAPCYPGSSIGGVK